MRNQDFVFKFSYVKFREHCGREGWKTIKVRGSKKKSEDQGVCCKIMFPSNIRSYTHKVLQTWTKEGQTPIGMLKWMEEGQ